MSNKKWILAGVTVLLIGLVIMGGLYWGVKTVSAQGPGGTPTVQQAIGGTARTLISVLLNRLRGQTPVTIKAIDGTTLTVANPNGTERKVLTDANTKFTRAGKSIALADLKVGDQIRVQGKNQNGTVTATSVIVVLPRTAGTVTAINGGTISIERNHLTGTVVTNGSTQFLSGKDKIALADIKVGDTIAAEGTTASDGTFTATRVLKLAPHISGQVKAVNGNTITLSKDYLTGTVLTNAQTRFFRVGKPIAITDIRVGDRLLAAGAPNADGTFTATRVDVGVQRFVGVIKSINGTTLTIQAPRGQRTATVSTDTEYRQSGSKIQFSDVKTGDRVEVEGVPNTDGSVSALLIRVAPPKTSP